VTTTILYAERPPAPVAATATGEDLWLTVGDLASATGWTLAADGLHRGDRLLRIPHGRERELVDGDHVNLGALTRLLEQPVIRDAAHAVWSVGEAAPPRRAALQSLKAPEFTLPDLEGRAHSLSQYRGRKVLLVSWASW
jgi:hypothetical protein